MVDCKWENEEGKKIFTQSSEMEQTRLRGSDAKC